MPTIICGTCRYFSRDNIAGGGRCRRHAPGDDGWPFMRPTDWCGEHSAFETPDRADPKWSPEKRRHETPRMGRMAEIAEPIAKAAGFTLADLRGKRRFRELAHVRQDAMRAIRDETDASLPEIGRFMNRDHSTVKYGIERSAERAAKEEGPGD